MYLVKQLTIWSGGLWAIDLVFLILLAIFWVQAYFQWKSGSAVGGSYSNPTIRTSTSRVKITQIKKFWYGVAIIVFWIISIIWRHFDI